MGQHALLSPSASQRWLNCTAAPLLEAKEPDKETDFTREGTLAHAMCAKHIKEFYGLPLGDEPDEIEELSPKYYAPEMDEHVGTYTTYVCECYERAKKATKDAKLFIETRLDLTAFIPDAFGTADAIIITDGVMEVIDFKYGKGVKVEAEGNTQMRIYALGAYELFSWIYDIRAVRMTIIQPRLGNFTAEEMPADDLKAWGKYVLRPRASEAVSGRGVQKPGAWCKFCKIAGKCKALAATCASLAERGTLSPDELGKDILPMLPVVKSWVTRAEDEALKMALSGETITGYKLVEGRSNRIITDPEKVVDALRENGFGDEVIYKPKELCTLTGLEAAVGRKKLGELIGKYIDKPQGKPTLAPLSDKRPAINPADDFDGID